MSRKLGVIAVLLAFQQSPGSAATIMVGKGWQYDYWNIQAGLDAAQEGDVVIVQPGIYEENIEFSGIDIVLLSSNPTSQGVVGETIIDGGNAAPVVTFAGTETDQCILAGFTIRNGLARSNQELRGGGICGRHTSARIEANIITANKGQVATFGDYGHGGAIADCHGPIRGNEILGNEVLGNSGMGGALYNCDGPIDNNLIAHNRVSRTGGALSGCDGVIRNNTIVRNHANVDGSALSNCIAPISNCIITSNTVDNSGGPLQGTPFPEYSCIQGANANGTTNIAEDPAFLDPNGPDDDPLTFEDNDYHLRQDSPCIDRGKISFWSGWPVGDLDGNCRLVGPTMDMGCYEAAASPDFDGDLLSDHDELGIGSDSTLADTDADGLADGLEILRGSDPTQRTAGSIRHVPDDHATIEEAVGLAVIGDEIVVRPGTYRENVEFGGKDIILRSTDPLDPAMVAATVIDGGARGHAVTFEGTESNRCILSGFTIQNGKALLGAGIVGGYNNRRAQALVENNDIAGNSAWGNGAGICLFDGVIRNNTIESNNADQFGGGLMWCFGRIEGNVVESNSAGAGGGGLAHCEGTIHRNTIYGNTGGTAAGEHGGGMFDCRGVITNNLIRQNVAGGDGGGMAYCTGTLQNNAIINNLARNSGGGAADCGGQMLNNVVTGNTADWSGGGLFQCTATIGNSIVWANTAKGFPSQLFASSTPEYSCIEGWSGGGTGNISSAPQFSDDLGQLSLSSPCIDAGNPDPAHNDAGRPPGLGGLRNDMGAYGGPLNLGWQSVHSDLAGSLLSVGQEVLIAGQEVHLFGLIANAGNLPTGQPSWVEFRAVDTLTEWYSPFCESILIPSLAPGDFFDLTQVSPTRHVYDPFPTGTYRIEMRIDATNIVLEQNELNNVSRFSDVEILPDLPDLFLALVDFRPEDISPSGGDMMTFAGLLLNQGTQTLTEDFWIEVFVWPRGERESTTPTLLCDSYLITQDLQPWEQIDLLTFPGHPARPLAPGVYDVAIMVDRTNQVAEQREDNNVQIVNPRVLYVGPRPTGAKGWRRYR